jgi:4-hydroxybenzoate polyprenyltransferase
MLKKALDHFVYSNLFIAACAVAMAYQTFNLFDLRPDLHLIGFIFFSTICSYSFHWWLTVDTDDKSPRLAWLKNYRVAHLILFFIGLAGAAVFSIYLLPHWPWLLLGAIVTFLYSAPKIPHPYFRALRKVALGKTIFLAFVWTYVTTILPGVMGGHPLDDRLILFSISRFFLIYAICILFDYRDRDYDKAAGIRSLITYLSERSITWLFIFSLAIFFITTVGLMIFDYRLEAIILLLIPGIIVGAVYNYARRHFHDMFYYFILDGLMALSAVMMLVGRI